MAWVTNPGPVASPMAKIFTSEVCWLSLTWMTPRSISIPGGRKLSSGTSPMDIKTVSAGSLVPSLKRISFSSG